MSQTTAGLPMTDAELIRMMQAGDQVALTDFYQRYLPTVWRFVYAQLRGERHGAEDVVSETFLGAMRSIAKITPQGGSLSGWLIGIARNKVADHRRRTRSVQDSVGSDKVGDNGQSRPETQLEQDEMKLAVARSLDSLPDEERQVLEWKYLDGCSVRDIAARLGRTEKSIESILYRARRSFRSAFSPFSDYVRSEVLRDA